MKQNGVFEETQKQDVAESHAGEIRRTVRKVETGL